MSMALTDKVNYLITEYTTNVRPIVLEAITYLTLIEQLEGQDWMGANFNNLSAANQVLMRAQIDASMLGITTNVKARLKTLISTVLSKAQNLVINQGDHISGMGDNVNDNGTIAGMSGQTTSLTQAATAMSAIEPGGAAGATEAETLNTPAIATLGNLNILKSTQITAALAQVAAIAEYVNEIRQLATLTATVLPDD